MSTTGLRWRTCLLLVVGFVAIPVIAFGLIVVVPVYVGMARRDAASRRAFTPLTPLRPIVLDNKFGVYDVQFDDLSTLTDDNVGELLTLNLLPAEYDLTLWIRTSAVTDASVSVLAQLNTTDTLILDGSGLTREGISRLAEANPALQILTPDGRDLKSHAP